MTISRIDVGPLTQTSGIFLLVIFVDIYRGSPNSCHMSVAHVHLSLPFSLAFLRTNVHRPNIYSSSSSGCRNLCLMSFHCRYMSSQSRFTISRRSIVRANLPLCSNCPKGSLWMCQTPCALNQPGDSSYPTCRKLTFRKQRRRQRL